ncbi:hypothetical protein [Pseudomonas sp.]|jgi:hypothetical protein|nr:hypothetical protein [Pseudomonas sp.]HEX4548130.1 hypothetical protein [Pseudomonas sp.]
MKGDGHDLIASRLTPTKNDIQPLIVRQKKVRYVYTESRKLQIAE